MPEKQCNSCKEQRPLSNFYSDTSRKDGLRTTCKTCTDANHSRYVEAHRDQLRAWKRAEYRTNPAKFKDRNARYQATHRAIFLVRGAKYRSALKAIPFDLDQHIPEFQERIDLGYCELTGVPFVLTTPRSWDSPSLDRIDPRGGYLYGNVRVVCRAINSALGDWGEGPLLKIMEAWAEKRMSK